MAQKALVLHEFSMPATLYLRHLFFAFTAKYRAVGIAVLALLVAVSYFFADMIYVIIILGFAAIPIGLFHYFVSRLTRVEERRILHESEGSVDEGGIVLHYRDGVRCYCAWEYVLDYKITKRYYLLYTADDTPPFLYLPREAFDDEEACRAFERLLLRKMTGVD